MRRLFLSVLLLPVLAFSAEGTDVTPANAILPWESSPIEQNYSWRTTEIKGGAEILTLFCRYREAAPSETGNDSLNQEIPLVAILRDTLGDSDPANDKLRYVWMLNYVSPTLEQRLLSAVPFFYWRTGLSRSNPDSMPKPLLDLSSPETRVWKNMGRISVQMLMFDPMMMPIRASSRAYNLNDVNYWRFHIDQLLALLEDPNSFADSPLSSQERATIIGRLHLSKKFLGGLVREERLPQVQEKQWVQLEETREHNWELLRQTAEKSGLIFEPLNLAEKGEAFAALWFPLDRADEPAALPESWPLLDISDPWKDPRLKQWKAFRQTRFFGKHGELLPPGLSSDKPRVLVPLAVYSLTHPRTPLVLVDFRDQLHPKRRELVRRTASDIVSGVLGLSRFGNWYFYAANFGFQFFVGRHGGAVNREARRESYARFQIALGLDRAIDPILKQEIQRRANDLALNPLGISMKQEMRIAQKQYHHLELAAKDDRLLPKMLDKDRRRELALAGESIPSRIGDSLVQIVTFGQHTRRAPSSESNLPDLDRKRRIQANIKFLNRLVLNGTPPEISLDSAKIGLVVRELTSLASHEPNDNLRQEAASVVARLHGVSQDTGLRAECSDALAQLAIERDRAPLNRNTATVAATAPVSSHGVQAASELIQ